MPADKLPEIPHRGFTNQSSHISQEVEALALAWNRGKQVSAAEILARHDDPESELAIRLIYEEACLRREAGLDVETEELVRRFPRWADQLRALFRCDRLLRYSPVSAGLPEAGETLGPFFLLDELGRGASGRTFLATDPTLADRPVVVKVLSSDQEEHLALAQLTHTHIVPLFSEHSLAERGLRALCMPYLGGTTLAQVMRDLEGVPPAERSGKQLVEVLDRHTRSMPASLSADGPFRRGLERASYVDAITWIAACLGDALHYAHARGFVHMDVKPSNVLITSEGQPMLLDFHLARAPVERGERIAGRLGGTPGWMSPEQQAAMSAVSADSPAPASVDGRSDLYALGLLLRQALFPADPGSEHEPASFSRPACVSPALTELVRKCLAPDPKDRYQDAAILAEDLRRHLEDLPLRGVRNRYPLERWRKWRRRHPGALAWGTTGVSFVAAMLIGGMAVLFAYRQRVQQAQGDLEEGRSFLSAGHEDEAIEVLKGGLEQLGMLPATERLRLELCHQLLVAEQARFSRELHELAELVRFRHGIDLPPRDEATELLRVCRAVWTRASRSDAFSHSMLSKNAREQIRTDLLELAAIESDLTIRLASPGQAEGARRDASRVLDRAEALLGSNFALSARRAQLVSVAVGASRETADIQHPNSPWEHYDVARYELRLGRIEAAAEKFHRVLETRPQDFWANFYSGLCAFRLGRYEEAAAAFHTCVAIAPESAPSYYNLALSHDAMGHNEEAYRGYTRALGYDPKLAPALLNRGILALRSDRIPEALADFDHGLLADPDRETLGRLHYNLTLAQAANGNHPLAREHLEKALRLGCEEARVLQTTIPFR